MSANDTLKDEIISTLNNMKLKYDSDVITAISNIIANSPNESNLRKLIANTNFIETDYPFLTSVNNSLQQISRYFNVLLKELTSLASNVAMFSSLKAAIPVSETIPEFEVITAPLVDRTDDSEIHPKIYNADVGTVTKSNSNYIVPVKLVAKQVREHKNGANQTGYWVGIGIPSINDGEMAVGDCAGWTTSSTTLDYSTLDFSKTASDDVFTVGNTTYLTYYFGYNPTSNKQGYIVYKYDDEHYVEYRITFDVSVVLTD